MSTSATGAAGTAASAAAAADDHARMGLPPRHTSEPDSHGISTVTEYSYTDDGKVEKRIMKVRTVKRTTRTPRAAIEREARMRRFGKAADSSASSNITYFDLNLVKLRRPGEEEDDKESEALIAKLRGGIKKSSGTAAAASGAASGSAGGAANPWEDKFIKSKEAGFVGAAEAASGGMRRPGAAAPGAAGVYRPPVGGGGFGGAGGGESLETTTSLKVMNLSTSVTEPVLREHFEPYGRVTRVRIMTDRYSGESRGFAFVSFGIRSNAQAAKDALSKSHLHNMVMDIEWAQPSTPAQGGDSMKHVSGYGGALPQSAASKAF